jgi:hypothetical protein
MRTEALLLQMRAEQREDHAALVRIVDDGFAGSSAALVAHAAEDVKAFALLDKRLVPIESLRSTVRWALGAVFSGFVLFMFDLVMNHLSKLRP